MTAAAPTAGVSGAAPRSRQRKGGGLLLAAVLLLAANLRPAVASVGPVLADVRTDLGLSGTAAAGGIALINSIGNLAGFGGPYLIGWVKDATGQTSTGLLVLSLLPLVAGLLVFLGGHETRTEFANAK